MLSAAIPAPEIVAPYAEPPLSRSTPDNRLLGVGLAFAAYALFTVQDSIVKHLVATMSVPQVLFSRSMLILAFLTVVPGPRLWRALADPRDWRPLLMRAALILVAWLCYFTASRHLTLAALTTLYFAAPIAVVLLAMLVLKETVGAFRWLVVILGFVGVVFAAEPTDMPSPLPVMLALFAACAWAGTQILARMISRSETSAMQMLMSNGLFSLACGFALPFVWVTPSLGDCGFLLGLAIAGASGQYLIFEAFRFAPASAIAPVEYSGLAWAFAIGWLFFAETPSLAVYSGAALIAASSLLLVWYETRALRRSDDAPLP